MAVVIKLQDLAHVIAVAESRNFTRAAETVNVSQPALSSKVKKLELTLGVDIFHRGPSEVTLTDFGQELVVKAREIVALARSIEDMAQAKKQMDAKPVRLGITPTLAPYLTRYFRDMMSQLYPEIAIIVVEEAPAALARMVETKAVDVALVARKSHRSLSEGMAVPLDFTSLWFEPVFLAVRQGHPLTRTGGIFARDVPAHQLIRFETSFGYDLEKDLPPSPSDLAERVGIDVRTARFETVCRHVAQSDACTMVNAIAANQFRADGFGLDFVPFDDAGNLRELGAISRPGCPRREIVVAMRDYIQASPPAGTIVPGEATLPNVMAPSG